MARRLSIELSEDAALVLFDLVARVNGADDSLVQDQAEARVLWDLEADLERALDSVVAADYEARLLGTRSRVRDQR